MLADERRLVGPDRPACASPSMPCSGRVACELRTHACEWRYLDLDEKLRAVLRDPRCRHSRSGRFAPSGCSLRSITYHPRHTGDSSAGHRSEKKRHMRLQWIVIILIVLVGCQQRVVHAQTARPAPVDAGRPPPPPSGPCNIDSDCHTYLDPCLCFCLPVLSVPAPVPNGLWAHQCFGGPPRNCGVESPCAPFVSACNSTTHRCVIRRTIADAAPSP